MTTQDLNNYRTQLVETTVYGLLTPTNRVTTLEVKMELRRLSPEIYWSQAFVSQVMSDMSTANKLQFRSTGSYRIYSLAPMVKVIKTTLPMKVRTTKSNPGVAKTSSLPANTITKTIARQLMENNKGHYFTVTFTKKSDGSTRVLNCQYSKALNTTPSVLVKVKAGSGKGTKSFDINTVTGLKIQGNTYTVI